VSFNIRTELSLQWLSVTTMGICKSSREITHWVMRMTWWRPCLGHDSGRHSRH